MKYLANWQPLINEDRHTALLFGFMRHAPVEHALAPWLSAVLMRPITVEPLERSAFWPHLASHVSGGTSTEPELVFDANDGEPLAVVIEVKPGYGMHYLEQISREVVDVALERDARRVACVMIGADLGPPMDLSDWRDSVADFASQHLGNRSRVDVELAYASFKSLGSAARECAVRSPQWSNYADDVVVHLQRRGLLGYDGAPMLDELEGLTLPIAVEAFNRGIRAARDFFLQFHEQSRFRDLSLEPFGNTHRMFRNGKSEVPTQAAEWFETTVAMALYRRQNWDSPSAVFVAFDLVGVDSAHADLCVGACYVNGGFVYGYPRTEVVEELANPALDAPSEDLPEKRREPGGEWRLDRRAWAPGGADDDIDWALTKLAAAAGVWDAG